MTQLQAPHRIPSYPESNLCAVTQGPCTARPDELIPCHCPRWKARKFRLQKIRLDMEFSRRRHLFGFRQRWQEFVSTPSGKTGRPKEAPVGTSSVPLSKQAPKTGLPWIGCLADQPFAATKSRSSRKGRGWLASSPNTVRKVKLYMRMEHGRGSWRARYYK